MGWLRVSTSSDYLIIVLIEQYLNCTIAQRSSHSINGNGTCPFPHDEAYKKPCILSVDDLNNFSPKYSVKV